MTSEVREVAGPVAFEVITGERFRERSTFQIDDRTGLFMAETPWGTFSYHWPLAYRGENLFCFLASLNFDYFMGKAAKQQWRRFDEISTVQRLRREIIAQRREYLDLDKDRARELWDLLDSAASARTTDEFLHCWRESQLDGWISVFDVSVAECDDESARNFWNGPWAALLASDAFKARVESTVDERRRAA